MILELFLSFLVFWYIYDFIYYRGKVKGPLRFPILGNIPQIILTRTKFLHISLQKLRKNYNDLFFLKIGAKEIVIINSYNAARDLLKLEQLNAREKLDAIKDFAYGQEIGILMAFGESSTTTRKFFMSGLAEFGIGNKTKMENMIIFEAEEFVRFTAKMASENNGKVNICGFLHVAVFNTLMQMISGTRKELDDPEMHKMAFMIKEHFDSISVSGSMIEIFPLLKYFQTEKENTNQVALETRAILEKMLEIEKKNVKNKSEPKNLLQKCAIQLEKDYKKSQEFGINSEKNLIVGIWDIFTGGLAPLSDSFIWFIIYVALNPETQSKIQAEIASKFSKDDRITLSDKNKLPYLQAAIKESLRISPVALLGGPRRTLGEIKYKGFTIPNNIAVLTNLYSINNDPKFWGDPEVFRPSRFIDENTGEFIKDPPLLSFGYGKKDCIGEYFAKDSMFLFSATIFKHCHFSTVPNKPPSLDTTSSVFNSPKAFELVSKTL